jgi:hypothetical protein
MAVPDTAGWSVRANTSDSFLVRFVATGEYRPDLVTSAGRGRKVPGKLDTGEYDSTEHVLAPPFSSGERYFFGEHAAVQADAATGRAPQARW